MYGSRSKPVEPPKQSNQPKDALAALMDGDTPDENSLRFPDERSMSWRAKPEADAKSKSKNKGRMQDDYSSDYHYNSKPNPANGEYRPQQSNGGFGTVKTGAANTGAFLKQKSTAGATYVKEKDWSKEKELAGKAGTATKNGAVFLGNGVAKGAGWLWGSSKKGIDNLTRPKN